MTKTKSKGVLKTWKEDRGFGFIRPDDGGKDVFIHISALKGISRRPVAGDVMYYQIGKDSRGKFKAINVQIEGVSAENGKTDAVQGKQIDKKWLVLIAAGLLIILAAFIYLR
ncbi:MAG: cold shock domain-containing protein [Methylococcaceae bacterium]